jgi:hypothetical protein
LNFDAIFLTFLDKLGALSTQKYSSHAVEMAFEMASEKVRREYIERLAGLPSLVQVIRNSFGNYVVQRALQTSQGADLRILSNAVYEALPLIPEKKIKKKWGQMIHEAIMFEEGVREKLDCTPYLNLITSPTKEDIKEKSFNFKPAGSPQKKRQRRRGKKKPQTFFASPTVDCPS